MKRNLVGETRIINSGYRSKDWEALNLVLELNWSHCWRFLRDSQFSLLLKWSLWPFIRRFANEENYWYDSQEITTPMAAIWKFVIPFRYIYYGISVESKSMKFYLIGIDLKLIEFPPALRCWQQLSHWQHKLSLSWRYETENTESYFPPISRTSTTSTLTKEYNDVVAHQK
jgi:hypothetical protein